MAALTVIYVVFAFREDASTVVDYYVVWGLAVTFLVEFTARLYDSPNRMAYLSGHWLDLVTAIPVPGVPGLRLIRLLRLLRFAKVGVLLRRTLISRGWGEMGILWPTLVGFWMVSAAALWLVEHDAPGSTITTFPDAVTAAFLTAATLGFGRHGLPVTQDGQIIAAVIVFFALGLWGFASSSLTRLWLQGPAKQQDLDLDAIHQDLHRVAAAIADLRKTLVDHQALLFPTLGEEISTPQFEYVGVQGPAIPEIGSDDISDQN